MQQLISILVHGTGADGSETVLCCCWNRMRVQFQFACIFLGPFVAPDVFERQRRTNLHVGDPEESKGPKAGFIRLSTPCLLAPF